MRGTPTLKQKKNGDHNAHLHEGEALASKDKRKRVRERCIMECVHFAHLNWQFCR